MTVQLVNKLDKARFHIQWSGIPDSQLILNFNPLIEQFRLAGNFVLLHWQAKPKFYRRWGMYYSGHDHYYPFDYEQFMVQANVELKPLQVSERKYRVTPTACLFIPDVSLTLDMENMQYELSREY